MALFAKLFLLLFVWHVTDGDNDANCVLTEHQRIEISYAASNITLCMSFFAAPTQFCEYCGSFKQRWDIAYKNLSKDCQDFSVYKMLQESLIEEESDTDEQGGIWSHSSCQGCTQQEYHDFSSLICEFGRCAAPSASCPFDFSLSSQGDICTRCHPEFNAVVEFHKHLRKGCQSNADIVDGFRRFLRYWTRYRCSYIKVSKSIIVVVLGVACAAPLFFYWTVYLCQRNIKVKHDEGIDSEHKPVVGPEGHEQTSLALYRHSMRAARLISQRSLPNLPRSIDDYDYDREEALQRIKPLDDSIRFRKPHMPSAVSTLPVKKKVIERPKLSNLFPVVSESLDPDLELARDAAEPPLRLASSLVTHETSQPPTPPTSATFTQGRFEVTRQSSSAAQPQKRNPLKKQFTVDNTGHLESESKAEPAESDQAPAPSHPAPNNIDLLDDPIGLRLESEDVVAVQVESADNASPVFQNDTQVEIEADDDSGSSEHHSRYSDRDISTAFSLNLDVTPSSDDLSPGP